jgi:hypothetical protein
MKNKSMYMSLFVLILFFSATVFANMPVSINETLANITCPSQISVATGQEIYSNGNTFSFKVSILDDNGKSIPNQRFYVLITGPDLTDRGGHQTDENGEFSYEAVIDSPIETGEYELKAYIDSQYCPEEIEDSTTFLIEDLSTQTCGDNFCSSEEASLMCKVNMCTCPVIEPCPPETACTQPTCECQETCEGDTCYVGEFYCDGENLKEEAVKCSNSCEDGACTEDPIAQPLKIREIISITTTAIPATQAIDRNGSPSLLFYAGAEKGSRGYSTIGRLDGNGTMINITESYRDTPIVEQDEILTIGFGTSDETDLINEQVITIETNKGTINVYLPEITGGEATNYWLYISEDGSTFWGSGTLGIEEHSAGELDPIRGWSASMITKHIGRLSPELEKLSK